MSNHRTPDTISELTEPSYLPDPSNAPTPHVLAEVFSLTQPTELSYGAWQYLATRAEDTLPDMFDTDPKRAAGITLWFLRYVNGDIDKRTYCEMMERAGGIVPTTTDEWATRPLLDVEADSELDGNANSPARRVLTTTVGHKATNAGEFKTFRRHMPIVDSFGNLSDAHALKVQADCMLSVSIHATDDLAWRLIGAQDVVATEGPIKGTGSYKSTYWGGHELAKSTPCARQPLVKYAASKPTDTHTIPLWTGTTATYVLLTTTRDGLKVTGHGRWAPTTSGNQPTTRAARKAKTAARDTAQVHEVNRTDAASAISDRSRTLTDGERTKYNVRSMEALESAETTPEPVLVEITVGRRAGKGYDVVIQRADDKRSRVRTTVTSPDRVAAVISNRLAQIG